MSALDDGQVAWIQSQVQRGVRTRQHERAAPAVVTAARFCADPATVARAVRAVAELHADGLLRAGLDVAARALVADHPPTADITLVLNDPRSDYRADDVEDPAGTLRAYTRGEPERAWQQLATRERRQMTLMAFAFTLHEQAAHPSIRPHSSVI
ncbi:hypothetical protein AB0M43_38260 [Longispora sp. NPDC051575]|uniref:hypothetical protein n=1 Tax=Longispora sp. NPDC051575 TaxID=3154943 RepID=UPI00343AD36A